MRPSSATKNLISAIDAVAARWSVPTAQGAVVAAFCDANKLRVVRNEVLLELVGGQYVADAAKMLAQQVVTFDDVVDAFAHLSGNTLVVPSMSTPLRVAGAVTASVLNGVELPEDRPPSVFVPACGLGPWLVAALVNLSFRYRDVPPSKLVADHLFGVEVDPLLVEHCRTVLALACLMLGDDSPHFATNLVGANVLVDGWCERFDCDTFDVVVMNPPRVRSHNLLSPSSPSLVSHWETLSASGWDTSFAFFELADRVRACGGGVGVLTTDAFLTSAAAEPLRAWMADRRFVSELVVLAGSDMKMALPTTLVATMSFDDVADAKSDCRVRVRCPVRGAAALAEMSWSEPPAALPVTGLGEVVASISDGSAWLVPTMYP